MCSSAPLDSAYWTAPPQFALPHCPSPPSTTQRRFSRRYAHPPLVQEADPRPDLTTCKHAGERSSITFDDLQRCRMCKDERNWPSAKGQNEATDGEGQSAKMQGESCGGQCVRCNVEMGRSGFPSNGFVHGLSSESFQRTMQWNKDDDSDTIVHRFTRLNPSRRTLTREKVTSAS